MATTDHHGSDATASAAAETATSASTVAACSRPRRWLAGLGKTAAVLLTTAAIAATVGAGTAWWWAGSGDSLATTLQRAALHLPPGMALESRNVTGSLRNGGHIGWLRWHSPTMAVEVNGASVGWRLAPLLRGAVQLGTVDIDAITIESQTSPDTDATQAPQPPDDMTLPVRVDLPFKIRRLRWEGPPAAEATALAGHYVYDGKQHRLQLDGVEVGTGQYHGQLTLQARAPMAVAAQLDGRIRVLVPDTTTPLELAGTISAQGSLATAQARLQVQGQLASTSSSNGLVPSAQVLPAGDAKSALRAAVQNDIPANVRATIQADIAPWASQPVVQANARFGGLDLRALSHSAPTTWLSGSLQAGPLAAAVATPVAMPAMSTASGAPAASAPANPPGPTRNNAVSAALPPPAWQVQLNVQNAQPGPWDQGHVPFGRFDGTATLRDGIWSVPAATAFASKGRIDLQGQWGPVAQQQAPASAANVPPASPAPLTPSEPSKPPTSRFSSAPAPVPSTPWRVQATLRNISPAVLHTQLHAAAIAGTASAHTDGAAIAFDVELASTGATVAPATAAQKTPPLRSAHIKGQWGNDTLELSAIHIATADATLNGDLQTRLDEQAGVAHLALVLPGGTARVDGQLGPTRGDGEFSARVDDAARMQRWLEAWPGVTAVFAGVTMQGALRMDGRWQGGWRGVQKRIRTFATGGAEAQFTSTSTSTSTSAARFAPAVPSALTGSLPLPSVSASGPTANDLTVNLQLAMPTWDVRLAPGQTPGTALTIALRGVQADLSGNLADAGLALRGEASLGGKKINLKTQMSGGMGNAGQLHMAIASLQLKAQPDARNGPWMLELDAPLDATVHLQPNGVVPRLQLEASASAASLSGPLPGLARLRWEPLRYLQEGAGPAVRRQLRTKGQLAGLPMAWGEALAADGHAAMDGFGVKGDLIFDGSWDIDASEALRATVRVERKSGDLQIRAPADNAAGANVTKVTSTGTGAASERSVTAADSAATTTAGVRQAQFHIAANGETLQAQLLWDSERAGNLQADVSTRLAQQAGAWLWPQDAALSGKLRVRLPNVGAWSVFAPPGWRVQGTLEADAALSGNRNAPQWLGSLRADGMSVRSAVDGVELRDGQLQASLQGNRLTLSEFSIHGAAGSSARISGLSGSRTTTRAAAVGSDGGVLRSTGFATWNGSGTMGADSGVGPGPGSGITLQLQTQLDSLRVLSRTDRQVTLSGKVQTRLDAGQLILRGDLRADRAVIVLPEDSAPTMGSDVVVRSNVRDREARQRAAKQDAKEAALVARPQTSRPPDIAVTIDMGDDFAVQGRGMTTRLAGKVDIRSTEGLATAPRVAGEIRTVQGQYRAYGQQLDIATGLARFNGPYDNPALDILAIRPNIAVRAGVQITGTALLPRVRLFSEPELPDAEKLSWVVLGRGTANGGAEAALLQQAALALLSGGSGKGTSGNIASKLGLDEISFRGPGSGAAKGSEEDSPAITFGKRLSQDFYLTYERSLSGTLGTLFIFYDLTRHLTLRAQAGLKSALDLIYTVTYE